MFSPWLNGVSPKRKNQILLGAAALCWAIWLNMNDIVFKNVISNSFLQVIFRAIYWILWWSLLHEEEERLSLKVGCRLLETIIMGVFANFGGGLGIK